MPTAEPHLCCQAGVPLASFILVVCLLLMMRFLCVCCRFTGGFATIPHHSHPPVIRALIKSNLLPRIVSGSSAGALGMLLNNKSGFRAGRM